MHIYLSSQSLQAKKKSARFIQSGNLQSNLGGIINIQLHFHLCDATFSAPLKAGKKAVFIEDIRNEF